MEQEKVLCAAIWINDGVKYDLQPTNINTGFVICGWRHGCCIEQFKAWCGDVKNKPSASIQTQGFLTSKNRFLNRIEARNFVLKTGQLETTEFDDELYSEDLY